MFKHSRLIWGLYCGLAGLVLLTYALASLASGRGNFVMPLDDTYIHFQYARQLASGQPYSYNPGLPPTSGATSFLYPYLLAIGYLLGFQGFNLGLWAMLIGYAALSASAWTIYKLVQHQTHQEKLAFIFGLVFILSGPFAWHAMSGMETSLVILLTLWTLYTALTEQSIILSATLFALIRPEGGLLAGLAVVAVWWHFPQKRRWNLLIPIAAVGLQPLVNLLFTGSAVASGNAAKSILGVIPFDLGVVIQRIIENFARMWWELLTDISPREGIYLIPLLLVLALWGLIYLLRQAKSSPIALMLAGWLIGGTLMISTLDTAFWHFKRYQMPFFALLFPLAAWGLFTLWQNRPLLKIVSNIAVVVLLGISLWTSTQFWQHFLLNVDYVYLQPLQMAEWLQANTPPDAVVAVHDTGMMRYMGGRTTLDMVGLTTPGAADYWRNGPGAVAEFLMQHRPSYIAAYGPGHGFGLGMIADTSVYGDLLASFPVTLDTNFNVALAADFQGIYQPDWANTDAGFEFHQSSTANYQQDFPLLDTVNVADIGAEQSHSYRWQSSDNLVGFPTEVHEFQTLDCASNCQVVDGGRRINHEESFTVTAQPGKSLLLITRVNPAEAASYQVYANGAFVATRIIPAIPGNWLEISTLIPAEQVTEETTIRIVPQGLYQPYRHWVYADEQIEESTPVNEPIAVYQDGDVLLTSAQINPISDQKLIVNLEWYTDGTATGDYKIFVHLYSDTNAQPVAQADMRPGNGTLPPGNWLPGVLRDTIVVDLQNTPPGNYHVAIGMYDPITLQRLSSTSGDEQGRLFIGDVEIKP